MSACFGVQESLSYSCLLKYLQLMVVIYVQLTSKLDCIQVIVVVVVCVAVYGGRGVRYH